MPPEGPPDTLSQIFALTGTPGTGKSSAAALLSPRGRTSPFRVEEVSELAQRAHSGRPYRGDPGTLLVDMDRLARDFPSLAPSDPTPWIVVGHLAHFLPVQAILLLRCDPEILADRLRRRGDDPRSVRANAEAELVDVILFESLETGVPVHELDTSARTPREVAAWVRSVVRGQCGPSHGSVDWLAHAATAPGTARESRSPGPGKRRTRVPASRRLPGSLPPRA